MTKPDEDGENYIEALKEVKSQSRASVAICGVPLGILLAQLRFLAAIDSTWVSLLATLASVSLFVGVLVSWMIANYVQGLLAVELYHRGGVAPAKGQYYFHFIRGMFPEGQFPYSEEAVTDISGKLIKPFLISLFIGYSTLFVLLLTVVWWE